MRQNIMWTSDSFVCRRIYARLGLNELNIQAMYQYLIIHHNHSCQDAGTRCD